MPFNFDQINERRQTHSLKWDIGEGELPLWVADMDFKAAPVIQKALENRVKNGIFGYTVVPEAWKDAIINWWETRHQHTLGREDLIFCTGIVPAISTAVKRLTNVGDNVLVQSPVYNIFFNSIENHGRHVVESELSYDGTAYSIDFEDLEAKLALPLTTLMILCNPHNPVGKIWSREELAKIGDLCLKHHVTVISDEIHCDLTDPGQAYIPFASVSDVCAQNSVTCLSASKAFNIAGLQSAFVSIPNEALRFKMERGLNSDEVAEPNAFAIDAVIAAFTEGGEWLDALRGYIKSNKDSVAEFLERELPSIRLIHSQATYLLWLDCSRITSDTTVLQHYLREKTGLYLSEGSEYRGNGNLFLRMNIACPTAVLDDALRRLKRGIALYEQEK
ncbi:MAG: cysteine-S-conjugate beta-lyase [Clostridiales bacterium]|nr:cysteine-S-conjugate beta-lyase [Clostridiales bacterium]